MANNPSMAALAQTQDRRAEIPKRPTLGEIRLLSIGTGKVLSRIEGQRRNWGSSQWAKPLVRLMLQGTEGVPGYQCRQMLGDRYHRLDYSFSPGRAIDLDDYKKRDRLVEIAETRMGQPRRSHRLAEQRLVGRRRRRSAATRACRLTSASCHKCASVGVLRLGGPTLGAPARPSLA